MSIQEAIKSEKPFKLKRNDDYFWIIIKHGQFQYVSEQLKDLRVIFLPYHILAEDWEIKND